MKSRCFVFGSILLLLMSMFLGCGKEQDSKSNALPVVKIAINTWPGLGPYYVAKAKGYDREEGIQLDVIMTENTEARFACIICTIFFLYFILTPLTFSKEYIVH